MSKAEQRALEAYPPKYVEQERHSKRVQSEKVDTHQPMRAIYIKGYSQAEKDLALTWEDIPKIFQISGELKTSWWFRDNEQTKLIGTQVFWEEVLKRFKESR